MSGDLLKGGPAEPVREELAFLLCARAGDGKMDPDYWIIGGSMGILALPPAIDFLKDKTKKHFRNNNRLGRDVSSINGCRDDARFAAASPLRAAEFL